MKKLYLVLAILVQVSAIFSQTHFVKGFIGGGTDQMTIVIKNADIGGVPLQADDEIAVFDGNLCVGAVVLTGPVDSGTPSTFATLNASADGGTGGDNGFISTHKMYFRFWDSSAGIEYHNIIPVVKDAAEGTLTNQFVSNLTVFVYASTANTDKTWTDLGSSSWADPDAWDPAGVPEPKDNVTIPAGVIPYPSFTATDVAYCGSLTFGIGVTMTFPSSTSGTASLIVAADITGTPTVTYRRYMLADGWHLISSAVSGQTITGFLSANSAIPTKDVTSRGMMDYSESADNWSSYFTDATSGDLSLGKGYGVRRSTNGVVTFTGSLINGNIQVPVSKSSNGWNLVGNPFTSAMYTRQEVFGFLTVNSGALDPSYTAIYLWDPAANAGSGAYSVVNNSEGQAKLASGQGFFIKAASGGNVTFTKTMQVHQTDASFKSAVIPWPSIVLNARAGVLSSSTKISFNEEMNLGLDLGYDAGVLRSGNGFDIYSRLVSDNGVNFAIQSLPGKSSDRYIIPVGVDAAKSGEIVFSANSLNLPIGYQLVLEDKLTNSFADLKDGEMYVANLAANSKGVGRFYLHVGSSLQTGIQEIHEDKLVVYTVDNTVYIKGDVGNNAQFVVYSIDGRLINRFGAKSQNLNQMNITGYTPGIYLINVLDKNKYKPVKFVVGN